MAGMNTQERINDICQISGLSESIVRRVFDAERKSIARSLRKGERANLIGRAVIRPEIRSRLLVGGEEVEKYIKLKCDAASALEVLLSDLNDFEGVIKEDDTGIRIKQIQSLT